MENLSDKTISLREIVLRVLNAYSIKDTDFGVFEGKYFKSFRKNIKNDFKFLECPMVPEHKKNFELLTRPLFGKI